MKKSRLCPSSALIVWRAPTWLCIHYLQIQPYKNLYFSCVHVFKKQIQQIGSSLLWNISESTLIRSDREAERQWAGGFTWLFKRMWHFKQHKMWINAVRYYDCVQELSQGTGSKGLVSRGCCRQRSLRLYTPNNCIIKHPSRQKTIRHCTFLQNHWYVECHRFWTKNIFHSYNHISLVSCLQKCWLLVSNGTWTGFSWVKVLCLCELNRPSHSNQRSTMVRAADILSVQLLSRTL